MADNWKPLTTSYQYNLHALNPEFATGYGYGLLWNGQQSDLWRGPGSWIDVGKVLVRQVLARHSASFTMFLEDPMDWGLSQDTLEIGNHAELGKHSCGYLDGHADYAYRETRGWCGPGWEAINPDWVQRVGMEIPRPVAYRDLFVNCVPPYGVAENGAIPDAKRGRARYDAGGRVNKSDASARTGGEP